MFIHTDDCAVERDYRAQADDDLHPPCDCEHDTDWNPRPAQVKVEEQNQELLSIAISLAV